jgi:hypothetical protein
MGGVKQYGKFVNLVFSVLFLRRQSFCFICGIDCKYGSAKVDVVYIKALGWTLRTEID